MQPNRYILALGVVLGMSVLLVGCSDSTIVDLAVPAKPASSLESNKNLQAPVTDSTAGSQEFGAIIE